jgi:hypothetical protein
MCGDVYRRQQEVDGYIECIKLPQRSTNLAAKNGAGHISNALHKMQLRGISRVATRHEFGHGQIFKSGHAHDRTNGFVIQGRGGSFYNVRSIANGKNNSVSTR